MAERKQQKIRFLEGSTHLLPVVWPELVKFLPPSLNNSTCGQHMVLGAFIAKSIHWVNGAHFLSSLLCPEEPWYPDEVPLGCCSWSSFWLSEPGLQKLFPSAGDFVLPSLCVMRQAWLSLQMMAISERTTNPTQQSSGDSLFLGKILT